MHECSCAKGGGAALYGVTELGVPKYVRILQFVLLGTLPSCDGMAN